MNRFTPRATLLAGAAILLALPAAAQQRQEAVGQPVAPSHGGSTIQQGTATHTQSPARQEGQTAVGQQGSAAGRLQGVEMSLRNVERQLNGGGQPNWEQARTAIAAASQALSTVPGSREGQEAHRRAQQEITEAQQILTGQNPDRRETSRRLAQAADSVAALERAMGGTAAIGTTSASGNTMSPGPAHAPSPANQGSERTGGASPGAARGYETQGSAAPTSPMPSSGATTSGQR